MPEQADYDWAKCREEPLARRFPDWAQGISAWRENANRIGQPGFRLLPEIPRLIDRDGNGTPLDCPCVFVSHRQQDDQWARRIAWLAKQEGFHFWLDVFDQDLDALAHSALTPEQHADATAAIIEMGLLNCSHVIAAMTSNVRGSLWVPYEYGRVKDVPPTSVQAACWRHPDLKDDHFPEYLRLGPVHRKEQEIRDWLYEERKTWTAKHQKCFGGAARDWPDREPDALPAWIIASPTRLNCDNNDQ